MDMVGHQAMGPDLCAGAPRRRRDQAAVKLIILGAEEHRLAAMTTLGDMMRQARHHHARDPGDAPASISSSSKYRRPAPLSCKLST
jgi:hypothetical protein